MSLIPNDQLRVYALHNLPSGEGISSRTRGGQYVGTSSAVLMEHEPTGTMVIVSRGLSQHRNREVAMDALEFILTHPEFK
jgi:protein subunit release factor A